MDSLVKEGNYFVVQSFMVKELELKGIKRDLFAIIYGFSQGNGRFTGSLQYLADWLNSNRSTIQRSLKELVEDGLLEKFENQKNKITFIEYCTKVNTVDKKSTVGVDKKSTNNIDTNNINNNNINTLSNNNANSENLVKEVIEYLNLKAETKYRTDTANTKQFILRRLKEKFTLDDFKKVIDNKVKEWKGTNMEQYLRPATLFGNKFESYLNSKINNKDKILRIGREYDKDELNSLFDNIEEVEL